MTNTNTPHEAQQTLNNTQAQAGAQPTNPTAGAAGVAVAAGTQDVRRNPMMERFLNQTPSEESVAAITRNLRHCSVQIQAREYGSSESPSSERGIINAPAATSSENYCELGTYSRRCRV